MDGFLMKYFVKYFENEEKLRFLLLSWFYLFWCLVFCYLELLYVFFNIFNLLIDLVGKICWWNEGNFIGIFEGVFERC